MSECRAVVDVGTNSVKLLVAEVTGHQVKALRSLNEVTRLGQGAQPSGRLQPQAIARTARVVTRFAKLARAFRPPSIRVVATSAAREASNQAEALAALAEAAGSPVEVISGDREAAWVFLGVSSDPTLTGCPLLIVDVGGGSTEIVLGHGAVVPYRQSFAVGALRLLEFLAPGDPPAKTELARCRVSLRDFLDRDVAPELAPALRASGGRKVRFVGTGGSAAVLARIILGRAEDDDDLDKNMVVKARQVSDAVELLWSYSIQQRLKIKGLPSQRADVILTGAAVFEAFLTRFGFPQLTVSRRGLRHGVLLESSGSS